METWLEGLVQCQSCGCLDYALESILQEELIDSTEEKLRLRFCVKKGFFENPGDFLSLCISFDFEKQSLCQREKI